MRIFNDSSCGSIVYKFRISNVQKRVDGLSRPFVVCFPSFVMRSVPLTTVVRLHLSLNIGRMCRSRNLEILVVGAWIVFSMGRTGMPAYGSSIAWVQNVNAKNLACPTLPCVSWDWNTNEIVHISVDLASFPVLAIVGWVFLNWAVWVAERLYLRSHWTDCAIIPRRHWCHGRICLLSGRSSSWSQRRKCYPCRPHAWWVSASLVYHESIEPSVLVFVLEWDLHRITESNSNGRLEWEDV